VTGSPTYRDLVDRANEDVARAAVELTAAPLTGRRAGGEAVAAYRALLGAIHAHVKALIIHADRFAMLVASWPTDQRDTAATHIVRGLVPFAYLPGRNRYEAEGPAKAWEAAKTSLGGATDLLTAYSNLDDVIRTPDAIQLQDPENRATGRPRQPHIRVTEARPSTCPRAAE
jgi:hypothetical protein